jgi:uncharacterized protein YjbJ (UPF0337 family)
MDSDRIEGKAKEVEGKLTDDESREAEGRVQGKWGELKDKADDTWEDAKDKAGELINRDEETAAQDEAPTSRERSQRCVGPARPGGAGPTRTGIGAEQAQECPLVGAQACRPRALTSEVLEGAPGQVVLDDQWAHVGGASDRRRVAELVRDLSHHLGEDAFCLVFVLGRTVLCELDRSEQRPTPGSEVLGRKTVPEVLADVRVEHGCGEIDDLAVLLEPKEARAVLQADEQAKSARECRAVDPPADEPLVLRPESELDVLPCDRDMTLRERRDPVGPRRARVSLRSDTEPPMIDETDGNRAGPIALVRAES